MQSNIERVDRDEVQALINGWLKAQLDEDAYLREAPEGELFAGAILQTTPEGTADRVVKLVSYEEAAESLDDPFGGLQAGQCVVRDVSELTLKRAGLSKIYRDAAKRHTEEIEDVAEDHVKALFDALGIPVDEFSGKFETATLMMMRAHRDLWEAMEKREAAHWRPILDEDPAAALSDRLAAIELRPPAPVAFKAPTNRLSGISISIGASAAIKAIAKKEDLSTKRVEDYDVAVERFIDFLGEDAELVAVDGDKAFAFMRALENFPSNATKRVPYRNLPSFKEKLDAAAELDEVDTLAPNTINTKYITPLRAIYAWHLGENDKAGNPFNGIRAKKPRKDDPAKRRRDVSPTEIVKLLSLPLFTGSMGLSQWPLYEPGTKRVNDWRFWVPLICLFSGMRLNEACGLGVADVRTSPEGIVFFHVRDEIEGQRLKSIAARRRIPVHSALTEVGFLRFVQAAERAGKERIFDDLEEDDDGYFSGIPSKFFAGLRPGYVDEQPEHPGKLTFHSKRHTVMTRLRAAGVREDVSKALIGHEQSDVHGHYGEFDIPTLKVAVEKINYRGLNLDRVRQP